MRHEPRTVIAAHRKMHYFRKQHSKPEYDSPNEILGLRRVLLPWAIGEFFERELSVPGGRAVFDQDRLSAMLARLEFIVAEFQQGSNRLVTSSTTEIAAILRMRDRQEHASRPLGTRPRS